MALKLNDIVKELKVKKQPNGTFYNLQELLCSLNKIKYMQLDFDEEVILATYYIPDDTIYELYDFDLQIFLVDKPDFESYLLEKTGKNSIEKIDSYVIEKSKNRYREIIKPATSLSVQSIIDYINYVLSSKELKERMVDVYGIYNERYVFFEYY